MIFLFRICLMVATCVMGGCGKQIEEKKPVQRSDWFEGGGRSASASLHPGNNFLSSNVRRYPHVGFVLHTVAVSGWTPEQETRAIRNAVKLTREEMTESFVHGRQGRWASEGDPLPDGSIGKLGFSQRVNFKPELVVIILRNIGEDWKDRPAKRRKVDVTEMTNEEATAEIMVGYLFPAKALFDPSVGVEDLIRTSCRDPKPMHYDFSQTRASDQEFYDIVDRCTHAESTSTPDSSR